MTLPVDWKQAHISALYKKGTRQDPEDNHPASLPSVVGKLMEKLIRLACTPLERKQQQFGFVSGRSTPLQLLHLLNTLTKVLDKGGEVDGLPEGL